MKERSILYLQHILKKTKYITGTRPGKQKRRKGRKNTAVGGEERKEGKAGSKARLLV
jgi:hypothetical protein